jgi:hypothetical protein
MYIRFRPVPPSDPEPCFHLDLLLYIAHDVGRSQSFAGDSRFSPAQNEGTLIKWPERGFSVTAQLSIGEMGVVCLEVNQD